MAQDPKDILVANSFRGWIAPIGTTLPDDMLIPASGGQPEQTNLDPAFKELGYTSPDGSLFRTQFTSGGIQVHQADGNVRLTRVDNIAQVQMVLREHNRNTVDLAFGKGTWTTTQGGNTMYEPPAPGTIDEWVLVLDAVDSDEGMRIIIERGAISSGVETNFARTAASDLPITFDALVPGGGRKNFGLIFGNPGVASA